MINSQKYITSSEDRATVTVNMCRKFREVWTCGF